MRKKLLLTTMALCMTASLMTACGQKASTDSNQVQETTSGTETSNDELNVTPVKVSNTDTVKVADKTEVTKLADITQMTYKVNVKDFTPEDVDARIKTDLLLDGYAQYEDSGETEVKDDSYVNMDITGTVDGVQVDSETATNYTTNLADGSLYNEVTEALIGKNKGDTVEVDVVMPEGNENAGKTMHYTIKINYIAKEKEIELSDEVAQQYKFESLTELREEYTNILADEAKSEAYDDLYDKVEEYLLTNSEVSIAQNDIDVTMAKFMKEMKNYVADGQTVEDMLKTIYSTDNYDEAYAQASQDQFKAMGYKAILDKIASDNNIKVEESDYDDYSEYIQSVYGVDETEAKEMFNTNEDIQNLVIHDKVMQYIFDNIQYEN